jgi:hypothetical protein
MRFLSERRREAGQYCRKQAYFVLLIWLLVAWYLYSRLPVGRAMLWTILGAYLLLPVGAEILVDEMRGGFRPVVFPGHGLLVAFFAMTTTVAAAAMWRTQTRIGRWGPGGIAAYLSFVLFAVQDRQCACVQIPRSRRGRGFSSELCWGEPKHCVPGRVTSRANPNPAPMGFKGVRGLRPEQPVPLRKGDWVKTNRRIHLTIRHGAISFGLPRIKKLTDGNSSKPSLRERPLPD